MTERIATGEARAWAPGRVNLIGDHTDTTGGLVLPLAIDLGTTVSGHRGGDRVVLRSTTEPEPAVIPLDVGDPAAVAPAWTAAGELEPGPQDRLSTCGRGARPSSGGIRSR